MINLLTYFSSDSILPLQDSPYFDVMEQLLDHCIEEYPQEIRTNVLTEIRKKSRSRSPQDINLGKGFALIHAKTDEVRRIHTSIGILPRPRKLLRGERVRCLFCIILSSSESREYLSMLARLGRLLRQSDAVRTFEAASRLFSAGDPEQARDTVMELLRRFEEG